MYYIYIYIHIYMYMQKAHYVLLQLNKETSAQLLIFNNYHQISPGTSPSYVPKLRSVALT
jgi:hypothetical protein